MAELDWMEFAALDVGPPICRAVMPPLVVVNEIPSLVFWMIEFPSTTVLV